MWKNIKEIKSKLSWSLLGNIIYALSQWTIITIIARFGSTEEIGVYSLGLAVTAPIVLLTNLQMSTLLATDNKNEYDFNQYYGSRIINSTIALFMVVLLALYYKDNNETVIIIILMGFVKYFESLSDICMGYFQKKDRIDIIGKSQLFRGLYTAIVMTILFLIFRNIVVAVVGLLIIMITRFIIYDLKQVKLFITIKPKFDKSWFALSKVALPLGIVSLINSLNTNIPRYLLELFEGINEVGIYSALSYILTASTLIITPVSLLVAPRLADAYNNNKISKIFKINLMVICFSFTIFLIIIIGVFFQGEAILNLLYGKKYGQYEYIFTIINLTILFTTLTTFFNINIVAARIFKIQPIVNFIVTIVTLISSYYYIDSIGLLGAAYSLLVSRGIQTILSFFIMIYAIKNLKKDHEN